MNVYIPSSCSILLFSFLYLSRSLSLPLWGIIDFTKLSCCKLLPTLSNYWVGCVVFLAKTASTLKSNMAIWISKKKILKTYTISYNIKITLPAFMSHSWGRGTVKMRIRWICKFQSHPYRNVYTSKRFGVTSHRWLIQKWKLKFWNCLQTITLS